MKFNYQYRTPDNVIHSGVIRAASRDAAYAALKSRGVKPVRVEEAPGFCNKLFGKGKRWLAIGVLSVSVAGFAVYAFLVGKSGGLVIEELPRQQIYGDPVVIQQLAANGWSFDSQGDKLLAAFAQPGRPVAASWLGVSDVKLSTDLIAVVATDSEELKRMKQIVNGMKSELRRYRDAGGSDAGYLDRLKERQRVEEKILANVRLEFDALKREGLRAGGRESAIVKWNEKNILLREMGFRSVALPEDW